MKRILMAFLIIAVLSQQAAAYDLPDPGRRGSISITVRYAGESVAGGSAALVRVGDIQEHNGNDVFVLAADFAQSGIALDTPQSPETAAALADFAHRESISGTTRKIDGNGCVRFGDLQAGLYLIVQPQAAEGYQKLSSFLVSVPMVTGDQWVYDVDASPKVSPIPSKPEPEIPATGDSLWFLWVFAASAGCLLVLLRRRRT